MVSLTILVCIVVLAIYWFAGKEFSAIAEMKGYKDEKYFWWCFLTGVIGWAMVIALPDRKAKNSATESTISKTVDNLPEL